jgi:hypothetical protein
MSTIFTATDLNTYMGKTLTTLIANQIVLGVNQWIEQRTHRSWGVTNTITERYDWASIIWLRHPDVQSITSVKLGFPGQTQSTIDPTGYFVNSYGRLTMYWGQPKGISARHNDFMEIVYVYGLTAVPGDLKLAALGIAAVMYNFAVNDQQNVVAATVGSYHLQTIGSIRGTGNGTVNPAMNTAEHNFQIIDSYALRRQ